MIEQKATDLHGRTVETRGVGKSPPALGIINYKIIRRDLRRKNSGPWEVFDLKQDRGAARNIAGEKTDLIRQTVVLLNKEVVPMTLPDI